MSAALTETSFLTPWPAALAALLAAPHRLRVHFQPVVDLRVGAVCGYEALARPEGGRPAAEWFAAAAREGCAGALEAQVLDAALVQRPLLAAGRTIAVNLSPAALLSPEVGAVVAQHGRLDGLVVEVTAQGPAAEVDALVPRFAALREAGAVLAADDADLLAAPLLQALDPELVKVHHERLAAGVDIAARQGAVLVAKGVETDEDLEGLAARGIRLVQGFALGFPVPVPAELDRAVAAGLRGLDLGRPDLPTLGVLAVAGAAPAADDVLALAESTPLADAARAAMARAPERRFDPVVALDAGGRPAGVVPIHRLVAALAA